MLKWICIVAFAGIVLILSAIGYSAGGRMVSAGQDAQLIAGLFTIGATLIVDGTIFMLVVREIEKDVEKY